MHYAGSYGSFRGNFVHSIIGTKLLKFCEISIFKYTSFWKGTDILIIELLILYLVKTAQLSNIESQEENAMESEDAF